MQYLRFRSNPGGGRSALYLDLLLGQYIALSA